MSDIKGENGLDHENSHESNQVLQARRAERGEVYPQVQARIQDPRTLRDRLDCAPIATPVRAREGRLRAAVRAEHGGDLCTPISMLAGG